MPKNYLNQKGFATQIILVVLLLAGIIAGYFLIKNPQIFKSRATNPPIVAKTAAGVPLTPDASGIVQITDPALKLELTSPLGPARVSTTSAIPFKINITSPVAYSTITSPVTITAQANDNSKVSFLHFEIYKNGDYLKSGSTMTSPPFTSELALTPGEYQVTVVIAKSDRSSYESPKTSFTVRNNP